MFTVTDVSDCRLQSRLRLVASCSKLYASFGILPNGAYYNDAPLQWSNYVASKFVFQIINRLIEVTV